MKETRRQILLQVMGLDSWVPRVVLPYAALSVQREDAAENIQSGSKSDGEPEVTDNIQVTVVPERFPAVSVERRQMQKDESPSEPLLSGDMEVPRFSLQLLQAGSCLLVVELPASVSFQSRDPGYLLLRDLLRAAGLPDSPCFLGDPVSWPLFRKAGFDQGVSGACMFAQSLVAGHVERLGEIKSVWLIGLSPIRFVGEVDESSYCKELDLGTLGHAWLLPGLEFLAERPDLKIGLWQVMQRVRTRWL